MTSDLDQAVTDFLTWRDRRDPRILARVFDATASSLLLLAVHLTRDQDAAEELVQTTFLKAMQHAHSYDARRPLLPWLAGILANEARNLKRRRARDQHLRQTHVENHPHPDATQRPTLEHLAERETVDRILQAIQDMPNHYRQVLNLRLVHGLSNVEIAHSLGIPEGTVRARAHRGLERLRNALPAGLVGATALFLASRGLAAVRAKVTASATAIPTPTVLAALMTTKHVSTLVATVAVLLLGWLGYAWLWDEPLAAGFGKPLMVAGQPSPMAPPPTQALEVEPAVNQRMPLPRTAADASPVQPDPGVTAGSTDCVKITLLVKGTGKPARNATFLYPDPAFDWAKASPADRLESYRMGLDHERWLERFGKVMQADRNGIVYMPLPSKPKQRYWEVCARLGELFAWDGIRVQSDSPERDHTIHLEPDLGFWVQTVDGQRRPLADVPLALRYLTRDERGKQDYENCLSAGPTDNEGRAHIRHLQVWVQAAEHEGSDVGFRVCLDIPGHDDVGVDLVRNRLPAEPVVLTVPPTGSVEVSVEDRLGAIAPGSFSIDLFLAGKTTSTLGEDQVRRPAKQWQQHQEAGRPTMFRYVGLGLQLEARTDHDLRSPRGGEPLVFAGPTRAGETVKATITLGNGEPVLVGRAVGKDGRPLAKTRLELLVTQRDSGRSRLHQGSTDPAGAFQVQLQDMAPGKPVTKVRFEALDKERQPLGLGALVEVDPANAQGDKIDLGDVLLAETPLLLRGQLVGAGDLSPTTVHVVVQRTDGTREQPRFEDGVTVLRKEENRFEVRGYPATTRLQVLAYSEKHLPVEPIVFLPGDQDVVIRLRQGGSVAATVLWGQPAGTWGVNMVMVPADPQVQALLDKVGAHRSRGQWEFLEYSDDDSVLRYRWPSLWPGSYRLEVRVFANPTPSHVVDGILIREGSPTRDTRLERIDLRRRLLRAYLRVLRPDGRVIEDAAWPGAAQLMEAGKPTGDAVAIYGTHAILVGARPSFDVRVLVPGYRPKTVTGITKDTEVRLEAGTRIRIRLKPAPPRLPKGKVVAVLLTPDLENVLGTKPGLLLDPAVDKAQRFPKLRCYDYSTDGELSVGVYSPGRYAVALHVRHEPRGRWDRSALGTRVENVTPAVIDVKNVAREQVFELEVPAASWAKAVAGR